MGHKATAVPNWYAVTLNIIIKYFQDVSCEFHEFWVQHASFTFSSCVLVLVFLFIYLFFSYSLHFYFPASGQAVVTGDVPSSPWFLPSIFIAHRVQQSHCSSIVHRVLLTHALALSACQFRFPQVNLCTSESANQFLRVCTRRGSNSRNWPIPGSRITGYATGATEYTAVVRWTIFFSMGGALLFLKKYFSPLPGMMTGVGIFTLGSEFWILS